MSECELGCEERVDDLCVYWIDQRVGEVTDLSYTSSERRAMVNKLGYRELEVIAAYILPRLSHDDDAARRGAAVALGAVTEKLCRNRFEFVYKVLTSSTRCVTFQASGRASYWIEKLVHGIPNEVCQIILEYFIASSLQTSLPVKFFTILGFFLRLVYSRRWRSVSYSSFKATFQLHARVPCVHLDKSA